MSESGWKQFERRLARQLGTERIPVTGERGGADFRAGRFAYQAKLGRRCPAYLRAWLASIVAAGARRGHVGVVVWKPTGARDGDALVLLRFRDWCAVPGGPRSAAGRPLTAGGGAGCDWCGAPFPPAARGHGNARRFCSDRCRLLAWAARQPVARRG